VNYIPTSMTITWGRTY